MVSRKYKIILPIRFCLQYFSIEIYQEIKLYGIFISENVTSNGIHMPHYSIVSPLMTDFVEMNAMRDLTLFLAFVVAVLLAY
ncbi:hypothetical protein CU102_14995 [Phyllobacterium brassicacearum]|uniref:Uncharacterized protein n=1 Tax=Phyllobacterium brassicacearum TaxID=314235 RepID=A0A2P7BP34_9HYPH|nr:hypothetical protein CU102_14995 [Phyllobacterium brassicacearum]TDQ29537.1 hypothetical protein DEV91_10944 [Phyllobacterium brassicacearum]